VASSLRPRRVARGRALQLRSILAYPESHEREGPTHRGSLALWWALARKQAELHTGGAAGLSGQVRKHALSSSRFLGGAWPRRVGHVGLLLGLTH
jgi:hypothetical protein